MWKILTILVYQLYVYSGASVIQNRTNVDITQNDYLNSRLMSDWQSGDPRLCIQKSKLDNVDLKRFGVVPGIGWDNLRNEEAGMVFSNTFSECRTTDDGLFLLPDGVFTVPVKFSKVEQFAEIIDNWQSSSSATSKTINAEAGGGFGFFSISGKFSDEHSEMKTHQYTDKAVTVRVTLEYDRYEVKLQPDPKFSPQFKNRLLSIANYLQQDQKKLARYEAQLLIRLFGTHVLTSVTTGAALVKDDYLKKTFLEDGQNTKNNIAAAASVSFGSFFNAKISYSTSVSEETKKGYASSLTQSLVKTYGGPLYSPSQISLDQWANNVDMNIVPMDRDGEPLNFFINAQTLPELDAALIAELEKVIRDAIRTYYEMNAIRGCTKPDVPNFSLAANIDDGTCLPVEHKSTFGGVYRTCTYTGSFIKNNPCAGAVQANPKTGATSCPTQFIGVEIFTETKSSTPESERIRCHGCGFLWLDTCCTEILHVAVGHITTYWCSPIGNVEPSSGYLFGGLYALTSVNIFTNAMNCPPKFYELEMSSELKICVCDDFELCSAAAIPFGGFFRCDVGNPMASGNTSSTTKWPKNCPTGYSQHLVMNDDGCAFYYCTRTGALSSPTLPPVRRPPFMKKPRFVIKPEELNMVQIETESVSQNETVRLAMTLIENPNKESLKLKSVGAQKLLTKNEVKTSFMQTVLKNLQEENNFVIRNTATVNQNSDGSPSSGNALSSGHIAGIAVGAIAAVFVITIAAIFTVKKLRIHRYRQLTEESSLLNPEQSTRVE